jgi:energy-coupling factor transport system ATP-binding protein
MLLTVSGLSYSPEEDPCPGAILQDISFRVERGDLWVVLGNSGAGKTTLLQLLAGLIPPSAGKITFPPGANQGKQHIGLVFQYPERQFFQTTVEADIGYALRQRGAGTAEVEARASQALSEMGLEYGEIRMRSPFELSGGEQRRLAIACVLVNNPQVLLLDDPIIGLDTRAKETVLEWIGRLNSKAGVTVLLATSCLEEVTHLAQKLLILNKGRQVYCGDAKAVLAQPQMLIEAGLRLPPLLELGHKLRRLGYPVDHPLCEVDEAVAQLKRLFSERASKSAAEPAEDARQAQDERDAPRKSSYE